MSITTMSKLKGNMCRWPIGDPKEDDFHFCGLRSQEGYSYCRHHSRLSRKKSARSTSDNKKAA